MALVAVRCGPTTQTRTNDDSQLRACVGCGASLVSVYGQNPGHLHAVVLCWVCIWDMGGSPFVQEHCYAGVRYR